MANEVLIKKAKEILTNKAANEPWQSVLTETGKPFRLTKPKSFDITIDYEKCRYSHWDPTGCKKCIKICPPVVLGAVLDERRVVGVAPQHYKLVIIYPELCNGCEACVKVCPYQAIQVKPVEKA